MTKAWDYPPDGPPAFACSICGGVYEYDNLGRHGPDTNDSHFAAWVLVGDWPEVTTAGEAITRPLRRKQ